MTSRKDRQSTVTSSVTKETRRMSMLRRFIQCISPNSCTATTPAGRGDTATRAAAMASGAASDARTQGAQVAALPGRLRTWQRAVCAAASVVAVLGAGASLAATPANAAVPAWSIRSYATPANLPPGGSGEVIVLATNLGAVNANAALGPIVISDTLPPQLEATSIELSGGGECNIASATSVSCEASSGEVLPYWYREMRIKVAVAAGASGSAANLASVSGGGAKARSSTETVRFSSAPVSFGVQSLETVALNEDGSPATQAGSHPFQYTTTFQLNEKSYTRVPGLAKDLHFQLPPGLIGNATAIPQCTAVQFGTFLVNPLVATNECPNDSAIGVASVRLALEGEFLGPGGSTVPIFNMVPAAGEAARFAFDLLGVPVFIDTSVRSDGDYGITVDSNNTSNVLELTGVQTSLWGVPSAPSHDQARGWSCLSGGLFHSYGAGPCPELSPTRKPGKPLLRLPTSCTGPMTTILEASSWAEPSNFIEPLSYETNENGTPYGLDGCNQLPFSPTIFAEPTSNAATSPTGLNFHLDLEDQGLISAEGKGQSDIQKAVVTLPQGFTTNPSVAEGLAGCPEASFDSSTVDSAPGTGCPEASKIGSVELESPLVDQKLAGSLYVAEQHNNPFHNLLTIYMVVASPELGVLVKAPGRVSSDPQTGQITTTFGEPGHELPQLPASHLRLSFRQGQRSPLITPPACGNYTVQADLYPWSDPSAPIHDESSFQITQGPEGGPCPNGVPPFHPNLEAGTTNNAAGTYSPFVTKITRKDSEQEITHFSIKLPPGVIGKLAGVSSCSDAEIAAAKAREREGGGQEELNSPSCPANSEVGHSLVGSGVGNVLAYAPGKLYLAGPYHGSNLSIVSITAAKVGPFDLGTVVVRFALRINPETAEVFVDSQGSDPIPHIIQGIPVHLRDIRAYVDRPEFVLNPTSCAKKSTASTVLGSGLNFASEADDQPVTVTSPFQAADCASLGFKPKLALSLKGGTKRGATPKFKAVLTARKGDANIGQAQVTLPRSEFLEQAHIGTVCTRVQFKEGTVPGEKCPAASVYGRAKAVTPLLSEPLQGPVYLRSSSHKLPDLVAALHNNQVDFALDGRIDSVKNGRIRNTFETVPDAPVTKFTLEMQGGKKGLLVNSTNICRQKNRALSHFVGQNGKVSDTTPLISNDCKGAKGKKKARAHR